MNNNAIGVKKMLVLAPDSGIFFSLPFSSSVQLLLSSSILMRQIRPSAHHIHSCIQEGGKGSLLAHAQWDGR